MPAVGPYGVGRRRFSLIGDAIGALDFAGGDVVHISSGLTGLVLCLHCSAGGAGYGMVSYRPHNVPYVALGATLLWFGWFGFNAGSEFAADGVAALALVNTVAASGAALASWMLVERVRMRQGRRLWARPPAWSQAWWSSRRQPASWSRGRPSSWA